jgi:hypothetical protein
MTRVGPNDPPRCFHCPFGRVWNTKFRFELARFTHALVTHDPRWSETIRLGCFHCPFRRVWNTKLRFELARFTHTCFETRTLE